LKAIPPLSLIVGSRAALLSVPAEIISTLQSFFLSLPERGTACSSFSTPSSLTFLGGPPRFSSPSALFPFSPFRFPGVIIFIFLVVPLIFPLFPSEKYRFSNLSYGDAPHPLFFPGEFPSLNPTFLSVECILVVFSLFRCDSHTLTRVHHTLFLSFFWYCFNKERAGVAFQRSISAVS